MSDQDLPWQPLGPAEELFREGTSACASRKVEGAQVALFRVDGEIHALDDRCTHGNAWLSEGLLEGHEIECPMHAGVFDVRTGAVLAAPAIRPARCHAVKVENGQVFIRITPKG